MARSFGRVLSSIWDDEDFRELPAASRLMYIFLLSQTDLEHSGIIPLRIQRWARDMGLPLEDIAASLRELGESRFVIVDEVAGELLVRSLIRRDEIWRQPNVFKAAAVSARASKSAPIKGVLFAEVRRLDLTGIARETQAIRDSLLTHLEPFGNTSPTPTEPSPRPNGGPVGGGHCGKTGNSVESAGQNPSRGVREPLGNSTDNGSAGPTGKGEGYGPAGVVPLPHSPTPSPAGRREPSRPLWPSAVPDVQAEEGDSFQDDQPQDEPPDLAALVAEVREIRPDWASQSIRRAMANPVVRERPWPIARRAMIAVARDPASKHPGRIAGDGDWWRQPGSERAAPERPPWCGECDEATRMLGMDTDEPGRCPRCKPKARAS
jgi:hypothetical protein